MRRWLTALGGGAAVAGTLVAVTLIGGHHGTTPAAPVPEPSGIYTGCETTVMSPSSSAVACVPHFEMTPSPTYGTSATPTVPPEDYNSAQIARLTAAFDKQLRSLVPHDTSFLDTRVNGPSGHPLEFGIDAGDRYAEHFSVAPDLRDRSGVSNVLIVVGKEISSQWPEGYGVGQFRTCPDPVCSERTGPHGEKVLTMWDFQAKPRIARIDVTKPDGTGVVLEVRNFGLDHAGSRPQLPLTLDQMIELACNEALVMPRL
ncbi:hypothetical protein ACQP00_30495 [Dactylosporangium sp. CS-047395]|uniref:hypothetical protein n=1 Tax=Dactylosporangium sp. CS-047395 TaxID=3239936 RepID=UPI003D89F995